jgi:hypothetical protein
VFFCFFFGWIFYCQPCLAAVLLGEAAAVALGLQLVNVDGDGADAEELEGVHGEVLLGLVHETHHHVVVVSRLLAQPDKEDADLVRVKTKKLISSF